MKKEFLACALTSALMVGSMSSWAQTTLTQTEVDNIYNDVWGAQKKQVSVHDPSIVVGYDHNGTITGEKNGNKVYFIFGSHKAWAKSTDLVNWTTFENNINTDYAQIFAAPAAWSALGSNNYDVSGNLWAPDVIWNKDMQKWCMYMSVNGAAWYSSIALLTADDLDGDWTYQGEVIFSRIYDKEKNSEVKTDVEKVTSETDLSRYTQNRNGNLTYSPNCIDPCVFYSEDGNLYMTYGSWFGGLWEIKLDKTTGLRDYNHTYTTADTDPTKATEDIYQGKKLAGGNHVSGEASYIQYINGKYYLFVTYGGLAANGGYNMRVFWSDSPEGPFKDMNGKDARTLENNTVGAVNGNVGLRLMSYYQFQMMDLGYTAQGHNSAFVDDDGNAYLINHTRFNDGTEGHQVRVHRLYTTKKGYLTAAPFEYNGKNYDAAEIKAFDIPGYYNVIYHGYGTNYANLECATEKSIQLVEDGTVTGDFTGSWTLDGKYITITLGNEEYDCVLNYEDYEGMTYKALAFSGVCNNKSLWGYRLAAQGQIYDNKTALVYNVKKLSVPSKVYSGNELPLKNTGYYNASISWDASEVLDENNLVKNVTEETQAKLRATITVGDCSYTQNFDITISSDNPNKMLKNPLKTYFDIEAFNNSESIKDINSKTGLSISFFVEGLGSDWDKIGNSTDNNYIMYLSVLHIEGCDWYEAAATASNGGSWNSFVGVKAFVTISYNPDGTIEYYKNGQLILKYAADLAPGYPQNSTHKSSEVCSGAIKYYKNGQFKFAPASNVKISNIIVGYSQDFDATNYESFDYSKYAFYEDYDFNGSSSNWTSPNGIISTETIDKYGVNVKIEPNGSGNRSAINTFSGVDALTEYTIQFDIQALNGDVDDRSSAQIAIINSDNSTANNSAVSSNYIFMLQTPKFTTGGDRTLWYVNNDANTPINLPENTWVRITCKVNTETKAVETKIVNRDTKAEIWSGTTETNGAATLKGLWLLAGRGTGYANIDNIGVLDNGVEVETFEEYLERISIKSIAITTEPTKKEYIEGQVFDPAGGEITVTYTDGEPAVVALSEATTNYDATKIGADQEITVTYKGKTAVLKVTVKAKSVSGIAIKTNPKLKYFIGDEFVVNQGAITVTYDNGTTADIPMTIEMVSGFTSAEVGEPELTITYSGKTVKLKVSVEVKREVESIAVTKPAKTFYFVGDEETLSVEGGKINVTYTTGDPAEIDLTEADKIEGFDTKSAGDKTITVTYLEKTATFTVTVNAVEVESVAIKAAPAKVEYTEGEEFSAEGGIITVKYNNGKTEDVNITKEMVSGFDASKTGSQTLTVTYEGLTAVFNVTVKAKAVEKEIVSIEVKAPSKVEYTAGEELTVEGGVVVVKYNIGEPEEVAMTSEMVSGFVKDNAGTQTLTVTYSGKSATFEVVVKAIETAVDDKVIGSVVKIWSYEKTVIVENGAGNIVIVDASGRVVKTVSSSDFRTEIQLSKCGMYIVKTGLKTQKVYIQ